MIKMTTEIFKKFSDKQEILDKNIRDKRNIDYDKWLEELHINHKIALRGEIAEFINEARNLWKYWKDKAPEYDRLIDEAVDIVHFIHLILNKSESNIHGQVMFLNRRIEQFRALTYRSSNQKTSEKIEPDYRQYLYQMYEIETIEEIMDTYAVLLVVLDYYQFTLDDIEAAYDKKNKVNHDRQRGDY